MLNNILKKISKYAMLASLVLTSSSVVVPVATVQAAPMQTQTIVPCSPYTGVKWPTNHATVYINSNNHIVQSTTKKAIRKWNETGVFHFELVSSPTYANIVVNQQAYYGRYLGLTTWSFNGHYLTHAEVNIDPAQMSKCACNWYLTPAHELGHAIGLNHDSSDPHDLMMPNRPFNDHEQSIDQHVISVVRNLYGVQRAQAHTVSVNQSHHQTSHVSKTSELINNIEHDGLLPDVKQQPTSYYARIIKITNPIEKLIQPNNN